MNLSKPLKFNERWRFFVEYLEIRETKRNRIDDIFYHWYFRVLWASASVLVIFFGVSHSGVKGLIHSTTIVASLWWLFYFLDKEILLRSRSIRKWLAFLMATVRLSRTELDLFKSTLEKSIFAFKNRRLIWLIVGMSLFLLPDKGSYDAKILFLLIVIGFVYIGIFLRVISPIFSAFCNEMVTAMSAKRVLSLIALQEFGGLIVVTGSLIVVNIIYLTVSADHETSRIMNFERCYSYFLFTTCIYFFSQSIPVVVSLIAPALVLEAKLSSIFWITITIISVFLGVAGISVIQVFVITFAAIVFWNIFIFIYQKDLTPKLGQVVKFLLVSILSLAVTSIVSFFFEVTYDKLGLINAPFTAFCILLMCVVWVDSMAFGLISSFEQ